MKLSKKLITFVAGGLVLANAFIFGSELPLVIYDDAVSEKVGDGNWDVQLWIPNYDKDKSEGSCSIMTGLIGRYGAFAFYFGEGQLSEIKGKKDNVYLCFDVKFTKKNQQLQVRFVDTDDGTKKNIPWRLAYDLKASDYKVDEWCKVEIPLSSMFCWGGWSNITNTWTDIGSNEFDFTRVEKLEFAAEEAPVSSKFLIDNIRIIEK